MESRAYNKAHAAVYALMHYRTMQLLTASRKDTIMGLTQEQIAAKEAEAAKKVEAQLDVEKDAKDIDAKRDTEV